MALCENLPQQTLLGAAKHGQVAQVDRLLHAGVAPDCCDENGWTALHWAAREGHARVVDRLLLAPRVDLEARTPASQWTALHLAAYQGQSAVVRMLVKAGADVNARDAQGRTPADIACTSWDAPEQIKQSRSFIQLQLRMAANQQVPPGAMRPASTQLQSLPSWTSSAFTTSHPIYPTSQSPPASLLSAAFRLQSIYSDAITTSENGNGSMASAAASGSTQLPTIALSDLRLSCTNLPMGLLSAQRSGSSSSGTLLSPHTPSHVSTPGPNSKQPSHIESPSDSPTSCYAESIASTCHSSSLVDVPQASGPCETAVPSLYDTCVVEDVPGSLPRSSDNDSDWEVIMPASAAADAQLEAAEQLSDRDAEVVPPIVSSSPAPAASGEAPGAASQTVGAEEGAATGEVARGDDGSLPQMVGIMAAAGATTESPAGLLEELSHAANRLIQLCEDAVYYRCKSIVLKDRTKALMLCLKALQDRLLLQEADLGAPLGHTLLSLLKVLENGCSLFRHFSGRSENLFERTMVFLSSEGFRGEFEILDVELHSCTWRLMVVLQMVDVVPDELPTPLRELREWPKQNQWSRDADLRELEEHLLEALCGLGQQGVQPEEALQSLEEKLLEHDLDPGQMVSWLDTMRAAHPRLDDHVRRMTEHVRHVVEPTWHMAEPVRHVEDHVRHVAEPVWHAAEPVWHAAAPARDVADPIDEVAAVIAFLKPEQAGRDQGQLHPPLFMISSSTIQVDEGVQTMPWGWGAVVLKAYRDRAGPVAIKVHNINQAGELDVKDAVQEAIKLCRISHHNVVRCFGILLDEVNPTGSRSISGSLVMEWVDGEDMFRWLQRRDVQQYVNMEWRAQLMLQVAAGMKHLHQQKIVHGDIKPQNMLLQFTERSMHAEDGTPLDIVPIMVKICDVGLAKYNATAQLDSRALQSVNCTLRYTSPERLETMQRSSADDIYAFGMLMYFAATSQEPFSDFSDQQLHYHVLLSNRPDIDGWAAQYRGSAFQRLASMYAALAKRCWQQLPEDRPAGGFQEIYQALEEMLWPSPIPHSE